MPQQRVKVLHDDVCTQPPNLTSCHSMSLERLPNKCQVNYPHHLPTKYGSFVKIGPKYSEVFGVIHQFLPYCHKSCHFNSINSGLLDRISPNFYVMQRNWCHLIFWNQSCDIAVHFGMPAQWMKVCRQFCVINWLPWQNPSKGWIYQVINPFHLPTNAEKLVKIWSIRFLRYQG